MKGTLALSACVAQRQFRRTAATRAETSVSIPLRPAHGLVLEAVPRYPETRASPAAS